MIETIVFWIIIAILSAIPLNLAAHLLGGESSIFKVVFINLVYGLISGLLSAFFASSLGGLILPILLFIILLLIYKIAFDVGWLRAFLIWITQFVILAIIIVGLSMIGISLGITSFLL